MSKTSYYPRIVKSTIKPNTKLGTGMVLDLVVNQSSGVTIGVREACKNRATAEYFLRRAEAKLAAIRKNPASGRANNISPGDWRS